VDAPIAVKSLLGDDLVKRLVGLLFQFGVAAGADLKATERRT
jgi:hypothetical protein